MKLFKITIDTPHTNGEPIFIAALSFADVESKFKEKCKTFNWGVRPSIISIEWVTDGTLDSSDKFIISLNKRFII